LSPPAITPRPARPTRIWPPGQPSTVAVKSWTPLSSLRRPKMTPAAKKARYA
jgi:hypothetical protein